MDIPYKKHTQHTYSMVDNKPINPILPCCNEFKDEWLVLLEIDEYSGKLYIRAQGSTTDHIVIDFNYCPWCGEEITLHEQRMTPDDIGK